MFELKVSCSAWDNSTVRDSRFWDGSIPTYVHLLLLNTAWTLFMYLHVHNRTVVVIPCIPFNKPTSSPGRPLFHEAAYSLPCLQAANLHTPFFLLYIYIFFYHTNSRNSHLTGSLVAPGVPLQAATYTSHHTCTLFFSIIQLYHHFMSSLLLYCPYTSCY